MFMFGVTTFMFALGITALVLATLFWIQQLSLLYGLVPYVVWLTITRSMVRLNDAFNLS